MGEVTGTLCDAPAAGQGGFPPPTSPPTDPFGGIGDLGSAFTIAVAVLVAAAQGLGAIGVRLLERGTAGLATMVGFGLVGAIAYVLLRRDGRRERQSAVGRVQQVWIMLPAVVMVAYLLMARAMPVGPRTEWYLGGDHVRHLIMTAEVQATGYLSYADQPYPRGWHTLLAATWSAAGLRPQEDITRVADLSASLVWLISAALALTTAALAGSLARRIGFGWSSTGLAGLLAGTATLIPAFLGNYQGLGLETSLVAACTLAVVTRSQIVDVGGLRALAIAASGVIVIAHTWQLLLPVVALAAVRSAFHVFRAHGTSGRWAVAVLAGATAAVAWPSVLAVVKDVGVQHATDAGVRVPTPWVFLAVGVAALAVVAARGGAPERWFFVYAVGPATTGLALAAYVGITPDTYYASKLLWQSAALALAPLSVVVVGLVARVCEGRSLLRTSMLGVGAVTLVFAMVQPAAAFFGVWSTVDGAMVLRMLSLPGAGQAQVVYTDGALGTDTLTRVLLDAVRPDPGPLRTPQERLDVNEECVLLRASPKPTVLTNQPDADVRARYGCAKQLRIVRLR